MISQCCPGSLLTVITLELRIQLLTLVISEQFLRNPSVQSSVPLLCSRIFMEQFKIFIDFVYFSSFFEIPLLLPFSALLILVISQLSNAVSSMFSPHYVSIFLRLLISSTEPHLSSVSYSWHLNSYSLVKTFTDLPVTLFHTLANSIF